MKQSTRSWQIVITVLLLCISPVLCQSTESEEYADELWTLNRIYHCPDNDMLEDMDDKYLITKCLHATVDDSNMKQTTRLHDFFHAVVMFHTTGWKKSMRVNAPLAADNENEADLISVLSD